VLADGVDRKAERRLPIASKLVGSIHRSLFRLLHSNRLLYNACWEDPRIDRSLFGIEPGSRVLVITSAGCNALDYLLDDPAEVVAVDINRRQSALLDLKLALIRRGDYEDLFTVFGSGYHRQFESLLKSLKPYLPGYAWEFWQKRTGYFSGNAARRSFYYHGVAGEIAWVMRNVLVRVNRRVRDAIFELFSSKSLSEQVYAYERIEPFLFGSLTSGLLRQPLVMAMLGVHHTQLVMIQREFEGGIPDYLREKLHRVFTEIPIGENYFWLVYLTGSYTQACCPNYLKEENFGVLQSRVDRVRVVSSSVTELLRRETQPFTHLALLDHQDWLAANDAGALDEEWRALMDNAVRGTRILLRSAGLALDFAPAWLWNKIAFYPERTAALHSFDRVGTYGSVHLGEVL
jgi:S-adenosylmethionine-diacylglycerol 3-amino-3-carboxypropyl transferase